MKCLRVLILAVFVLNTQHHSFAEPFAPAEKTQTYIPPEWFRVWEQSYYAWPTYNLLCLTTIFGAMNMQCEWRRDLRGEDYYGFLALTAMVSIFLLNSVFYTTHLDLINPEAY